MSAGTDHEDPGFRRRGATMRCCDRHASPFRASGEFNVKESESGTRRTRPSNARTKENFKFVAPSRSQGQTPRSMLGPRAEKPRPSRTD